MVSTTIISFNLKLFYRRINLISSFFISLREIIISLIIINRFNTRQSIRNDVFINLTENFHYITQVERTYGRVLHTLEYQDCVADEIQSQPI